MIELKSLQLLEVDNFKNGIFNDIMLVKSEFQNSNFENCQIENCNLIRETFYDVNFKNGNFIKVNLIASDFSNFEFIETKFKNSKLVSIGVKSIKILKPKQFIEIKKSSNFGKILKQINPFGKFFR